jgi:hypothetical protein
MELVQFTYFVCLCVWCWRCLRTAKISLDDPTRTLRFRKVWRWKIALLITTGMLAYYQDWRKDDVMFLFSITVLTYYGALVFAIQHCLRTHTSGYRTHIKRLLGVMAGVTMVLSGEFLVTAPKPLDFSPFRLSYQPSQRAIEQQREAQREMRRSIEHAKEVIKPQ